MVDHWECLSNDTVAQLLRFDGWWTMNRDENGRWIGRGSRRPRDDSADQVCKKNVLQLKGTKRVTVELHRPVPHSLRPFPLQSAST